jgi:N-acetylneuraminic acid mutarotase
VPYLGHPLASAELYDPTTGAWSSAGTMRSAHWLHTATLLPNGLVLVAGGCNSQGTVVAAELYDPATNTWATTGSMTVSRAQFGMAPLPNGTVLVAGGESSGSPTGRLSGAEIYTPAS